MNRKTPWWWFVLGALAVLALWGWRQKTVVHPGEATLDMVRRAAEEITRAAEAQQRTQQDIDRLIRNLYCRYAPESLPERLESCDDIETNHQD